MLVMQEDADDRNSLTQKKKDEIEFISHELKTPLSCTVMFIQNLLGLQLPEEARKLVKMIDIQIKFAMFLVNDF
jgi:signal transduction histidine kinase